MTFSMIREISTAYIDNSQNCHGMAFGDALT